MKKLFVILVIFIVVLLSGCTASSVISEDEETVPEEKVKLDAPTNLVATAMSDQHIKIEWDAIDGAEKYAWRVSTDSSFYDVIKSDYTYDTIDLCFGLDADETYYAQVKAQAQDKKDSDWSDYDFCTTESNSAVSTPTISPNGGNFTTSQVVTISCATSGATIKYTTNGTTPNLTNGTIISSGSGFTIYDSTTVKAVAYKSGMTTSNVASVSFTKTTVPTVSTPTIAPNGGNFTTSQVVTISCATAGATIKYTTNGTTPTSSNGTIISSGSGFTVYDSTTVKAVAYKSGMTTSNVASVSFTEIELTVDTPENVRASQGDYLDRITVEWNKVSGATRYYIYRSEEEYETYVLQGSTTADYHQDYGVIPGKDYYYEIRAAINENYSGYSNPAMGYRDIGIPTGVIASKTSGSSYILVSWDEVYGATKYSVVRSTSLTGTYDSSWNDSFGNTTTNNYIQDYNATPGVTYYYKLFAMGEYRWAWSEYCYPVSGHR